MRQRILFALDATPDHDEENPNCAAEPACTTLAVPHSPVMQMVGSASHPEEPDFEAVCPVCGEYWPCQIAWLSGLDLVEGQRARNAVAEILATTTGAEQEAPF
jgi:hypothetical protein